MDIHQIEAALDRADFQYRLEAVKALKDYAANIAVPLLTSKLNDPEFLVRSFVCMGLGKQQTAESFAALLEIIKFDNTPNVRAEAANSLSLFGKCAASHLVTTFVRDDHWLVRRSILAALIDLDCQNEVLEVCLEALKSDDLAVREAAIDALGTLTTQEPKAAALAQLLDRSDSSSSCLCLEEIQRARVQSSFEQTTPGFQSSSRRRSTRRFTLIYSDLRWLFAINSNRLIELFADSRT
jgi:HEAT repeats/HEAT repeat